MLAKIRRIEFIGSLVVLIHIELAAPTKAWWLHEAFHALNVAAMGSSPQRRRGKFTRSDNHRFAPQIRIISLFHRCVESVRVEMEDDAKHCAIDYH